MLARFTGDISAPTDTVWRVCGGQERTPSLFETLLASAVFGCFPFQFLSQDVRNTLELSGCEIPYFGQGVLQQLGDSPGPNLHDVGQRVGPTRRLDSREYRIDDDLLILYGFQQSRDGFAENSAFRMLPWNIACLGS